MIGKLVRRMLVAQVLSALTVSLCLLIDNMMIGRYLGVPALAADSLANPLLLALGAVGTILATGVQVACGKSLGKGSQAETNVCYSTAMVTALVFSAVFALFAVTLHVPLAKLLGANEAQLIKDTGGYIAGFSIGAPATVLALILIPFLQIAGQSGLLVVAVLMMTVTDVAFDLLSVFVFKGGMFDMGLASSLSYYMAVIIAGSYFLSHKCVFKFAFPNVKLRKLKEFLIGGAPTVFWLVASVLLVYVMNMILMDMDGDNTLVAAFTVVSTIGNASNCISTGTGGVALTLSSVFYTEEDKTGLKALLSALFGAAATTAAAVTAALLIFAPQLVSLFIPEAGTYQDTVIFALRMYSLGLLPYCINSAFKNCYQGTGRVKHMEAISVLEGIVLPVAAALMLRQTAGRAGIWCYFLVGEVLTLAGIVMWVWLKKHTVTLRTEDLLLLDSGFGVPPEDMLETDIHDINDVINMSCAASEFCRAHGGDERLSANLALCVEEMGTNIVTHGFAPNKKNNFSIRLQYKDKHWTLRFRDDCKAFDPVSHLAGQTGSESMGIRLAMRTADEARYTYSMNLNNLMMILRDKN